MQVWSTEPQPPAMLRLQITEHQAVSQATEGAGQEQEQVTETEITDLEPYRTLDDPAASKWLKDALRSALGRDPVDAANEAEYLAKILAERCSALLQAQGK